MKKIGTGDFHIINGVLKTAHSLFKRLGGIQAEAVNNCTCIYYKYNIF